jgi:hypothetical protein
MFASSSFIEHLVRGTIGMGALWAAVWMGTDASSAGEVGSLLVGLLSLAAFRGCPVCWAIGLFSTARQS